MAVRDITTVYGGLTPLSLTASDGSTAESSAIDLAKADTAVAFFAVLGRALESGESVTFSATTSDTSSGTYTAINSAAYLPSWNKDCDFKNPTSPFIQPFGFIDNKRYVKIAIESTIVDTQATLTGGASPTDPTTMTETDYSFDITIDGTEYNITGLDLSAATTGALQAAAIQAAIVSAGDTDATCTFTDDVYVIKSGTEGATSTITALSDGATGTAVAALLKLDAANATAVQGLGDFSITFYPIVQDSMTPFWFWDGTQNAGSGE